MKALILAAGYRRELLEALLAGEGECDARVVEVPASWWCEIDDAEDLARAQQQFLDDKT